MVPPPPPHNVVELTHTTEKQINEFHGIEMSSYVKQDLQVNFNSASQYKYVGRCIYGSWRCIYSNFSDFLTKMIEFTTK